MLTLEEKRKKHADYMREYSRKNAIALNARRRTRSATPEARAKKQAADKAYREKLKASGAKPTAEQRLKQRMYAAEYRKQNSDAVLAAKRKYYASEKGKAAKARHDAAFIASGGRAKAEAKRAAKPVSEARKAIRLAYQLACTVANKQLDEFSKFVLREAVALRKQRERALGTKWHVDHIFPVSKGGTGDYDNIQVVPALWNRQKSNKHSERFFAHAR